MPFRAVERCSTRPRTQLLALAAAARRCLVHGTQRWHVKSTWPARSVINARINAVSTLMGVGGQRPAD